MSKQSAADESLDAIFIDGDQSYEGAKNDIKLYVPALKTMGLLIFDDYGKAAAATVAAVIRSWQHVSHIGDNTSE